VTRTRQESNRNYHLVHEGKVALYSPWKPEDKAAGAPMSSRTGVFYNPAMIFNRDISVMVLDQVTEDGMDVLDGLSATGVRGLRYLKECRSELNVSFNDRSRDSLELILKNIRHNLPEAQVPLPDMGGGNERPGFAGGCIPSGDDTPNIQLENKDLNLLLHSKKYHVVDIDPFGSPVAFLDSAMKGLRRKGILAVTATDTATLCGTYPKTSHRRYGSWMPRNPFTHEAGVRNLIAAVQRVGARYNRALVPLLSYASHYYYRVFFRAHQSRERTNELLGQLGYLRFSRDSSSFSRIPFSKLYPASSEGFCLPEKERVLGPVWLGPLYDEGLLGQLCANLADFPYLLRFREVERQLRLWREEANLPPFFYRSDLLASRLKRAQPRMERVFEYLKDKGFAVSRTHFDPYGIKTDAPYEEMETCFKGN